MKNKKTLNFEANHETRNVTEFGKMTLFLGASVGHYFSDFPAFYTVTAYKTP